MTVREFRSRRPRREAQGHHEIGDRRVKRGSVPEFRGGELGHHSFGYFSWMSKKSDRRRAAVSYEATLAGQEP